MRAGHDLADRADDAGDDQHGRRRDPALPGDAQGEPCRDRVHARVVSPGRRAAVHAALVCVGEFVVWGAGAGDGGAAAAFVAADTAAISRLIEVFQSRNSAKPLISSKSPTRSSK